jgi:hypothetical protein
MGLVAVKGILVRLVAAAAILASAAAGSGCFVARGFVDGYDAALGPAEYRAHFVVDVVPCESEWDQNKVSPSGHLGLAQFAPGTWASYARFGAETDWRSSWEQGWTAANLLGDLLDGGVSPGSTAGWGTCWWEGLGK